MYHDMRLMQHPPFGDSNPVMALDLEVPRPHNRRPLHDGFTYALTNILANRTCVDFDHAWSSCSCFRTLWLFFEARAAPATFWPFLRTIAASEASSLEADMAAAWEPAPLLRAGQYLLDGWACSAIQKNLTGLTSKEDARHYWKMSTEEV